MTTPTTTPRITCGTCGGRRTITRLVPEVRTGTFYPDGWPADGGKPVRMTFETGATVERLFECEGCHGSGRVSVPDQATTDGVRVGAKGR